MNKYPYIGEYMGNVTLFTGKDSGVSIVNSGCDQGHYSEEWGEIGFTNITHEYLANTYGEVTSPEHAEFIIELASQAGFFIACGYSSSIKFFCTNNESLVFCRAEQNAKRERKQITIPLPPKADKKELSSAPPESLNFRCVMVDVEWPQIGEKVAWGSGHTGVIKSLSDGFAWVKRSDNSQYVTLYTSSLKKPKTPEEELRDLLNELWHENGGDFDDFVGVAIHHVIKKPQ